MNSNPDSGIEITRGETLTKKGPMLRWMRSFRERISSNRLDTRSWSLPFQNQQVPDLRRNLNSEEQLTSKPANQQVNSSADQIQSDIDQLDPRSFEERSIWAEQLNQLRQMEEPVVIQNDSDNQNTPEPLIGDNTRDVLSYNQLLDEARAILDSSENPESKSHVEENPTNLIDVDFSNEGVSDRQYFFSQYLHTRITEVPVDDLIFELQY